jgi:hypothetical protein
VIDQNIFETYCSKFLRRWSSVRRKLSAVSASR